jgi:hypothetical protein
VLFLQPCFSASAREHRERERERALHLEAVISCREGKPDFVKPCSTCVAQIVEICEASSQMSQIWSCISASLFCHSHSAAQHNVTSCNHHTNRIPCLDNLEHCGRAAIISAIGSHNIQIFSILCCCCKSRNKQAAALCLPGKSICFLSPQIFVPL